MKRSIEYLGREIARAAILFAIIALTVLFLTNADVAFLYMRF